LHRPIQSPPLLWTTDQICMVAASPVPASCFLPLPPLRKSQTHGRRCIYRCIHTICVSMTPEEKERKKKKQKQGGVRPANAGRTHARVPTYVSPIDISISTYILYIRTHPSGLLPPDASGVRAWGMCSGVHACEGGRTGHGMSLGSATGRPGVSPN